MPRGSHRRCTGPISCPTSTPRYRHRSAWRYFPEHGRDMSTLLKNADAAMYQAKRDGRNQFSFFNPIRYERAAREVQLGIELVKAVQSDSPQFICEYQPQIEMASGRVVGLGGADPVESPGARHADARPFHRRGRSQRPVRADHSLGAERGLQPDQPLAARATGLRCPGRGQRRGTRDGLDRAADPGAQRARQARHRASD